MSQAPTRQYLRVCQVITGKNGSGLQVEGLRVEFTITKTIGRAPNTAKIKIYNLSQATEGQIKGEFDEVLLNAGYQGASLLIFRGNIRHADAYRDGVNRILELDCADGDKDFRKAIVNTTLAKGTTTAQVVDHVIQQFETTTRGTIILASKARPRGLVLCGMARDVLDRVASEQDAHWSIQDGALHIVPVDKTLPSEAIVINSGTGMLGAPVRDDKGIKVRCLLNPRIKVNGKIWLDNNDFRDQVAKTKTTYPGAKPPKKSAKTKRSGTLARLDPDGIYKCFRVDHEGDTRGEKWETTIMCVALDAAIPSTRTATAAA
ncbi:MAG TPA: hypothetical protein VLT58_09740 [Polyangia bacterium]|nr:hypothetical protein [Polyangia bacterium]